jgi:hypothetical protein
MNLKHALQIIVESLRLTRIALGRIRACHDFGAEAGDDRSDTACALLATIFLPLPGDEQCRRLEIMPLVFEAFLQRA